MCGWKGQTFVCEWDGIFTTFHNLSIQIFANNNDIVAIAELYTWKATPKFVSAIINVGISRLDYITVT